jgi:hypothetical protein
LKVGETRGYSGNDLAGAVDTLLNEMDVEIFGSELKQRILEPVN